MTRVILEDWLARAAAQLTLPGAQPACQQRQGHRRHTAALDRWLDRFLARWLPDEDGATDAG